MKNSNLGCITINDDVQSFFKKGEKMRFDISRVYDRFDWLENVFSAKKVHSARIDRMNERLFHKVAGHSEGRYSRRFFGDSQLTNYHHWSRKMWLINNRGHVVAPVHPRWWTAILFREVYAVMLDFRSVIHEITYIVEVEQHGPNFRLCVYQLLVGESIIDFFSVEEMECLL